MKINWKGNAVIRLMDGENEFELQQRGFLKTQFVLSDKKGNGLMLIRPDFQWKTYNYYYELEASDQLKQLHDYLLLGFAALHNAIITFP